MKFKELIEVNHDIHQNITLFGAEGEAVRAVANFQQVMRERVSRLEAKSQGFLEREVPAEIIEAFRPLYDIYREDYYKAIGKHLLPI